MQICRKKSDGAGRVMRNVEKIVQAVLPLCINQCSQYDAVQDFFLSDCHRSVSGVVSDFSGDLFPVPEISESEGFYLF